MSFLAALSLLHIIAFYPRTITAIHQPCDRRTSEQQNNINAKPYININSIDPGTMYTPAEIGNVEAIWIGWPKYHYKSTLSTTDVVINMIDALCHSHNAKDDIISSRIVIQVETEDYSQAETTLKSEDLLDCVEFSVQTRDDKWIRDIGPVFAYYNDKLVGIDFDFDFWSGADQAGSDYTKLEESLDRLIFYDDSSVSSIINTCLVGEGGNREFNGKGLLLMNQNVEELRNVGRNIYGVGSWSLADSETEYKKLFGVNTIIWLNGIMSNDQIVSNPSYGPCTDCIAFGWGTGGHIDEIARFVDKKTIAILKITDEDIGRDEYSDGQLEEDKRLMDDNIAYLKENFDDLNIVEIPLAPAYWTELTEADDAYYWYEGLAEFDELVDENEIIYTYAASSYLNFAVSNQAILIPSYYAENDKYLGFEWVKERDDEVLEIYQNVFAKSGRNLVQINPIAINVGGGGMHCISAHQSKKKKRKKGKRKEKHMHRKMEKEEREEKAKKNGKRREKKRK